MDIPKLSFDQWEFLAVLKACGKPVPINLVKTMVPLEQEPLEDLLNQWGILGLITKTEDDLISLTSDLPKKVRLDLEKLNPPEQLSALIEKISYAPTENMGKVVMAKPLAQSERKIESAYIELDLADEFIAKQEYFEAYQNISTAVSKLLNDIESGGEENRVLFVDSVLKLSHMSFIVGRGMRSLGFYLQAAINVAKSSGNNRSYALACLHLGRYLSYLGERSKGFHWLSVGKEEVEKLGDTEIVLLASDFIGLYFQNQRRFEEAITHFERADLIFTFEKYQPLIFPMSLWHLGLALFKKGDVRRALGQLQGFWQIARDMGWTAVASISRSLLGLTLAFVQKKKEALFHLKTSLAEAMENKNAYSLYLARLGLALQSYNDGDIKKAYDLVQIAIEEAKNAKSAYAASKFFLLEMLASFNDQKLEPIANNLKYKDELERSLSGSNQIEKAIALKLKAEKYLRSGQKASSVMKFLNASINSLKETGELLVLKDILITIIRLHIREGAQLQARSLAQKIWKEIRRIGLGSNCFPDDLKYLLEGNFKLPKENSQQNYIYYLNSFHGLDTIKEEDELVCSAMRGMLQLFGAERCALLGFSSLKGQMVLLFRGGCNITEREINSKGFKSNLSLIHQALRENKLIRVTTPPKRNSSIGVNNRRVLIIPVQVSSGMKGALYFENSYLEDNFDFFAPEDMVLLANHFIAYLQHLLDRIRLHDEIKRLTSYNIMQMEQIKDNSIIGESPVMLKIFNEVEKSAKSKATVLITGETGTGKELTVKMLHKLSNQSSGPLIVIDSATIPENLVESELFGHEKGAFTGAEKMKRGRMELAHEGTLFIDEIGELSLQIQSKLLRALEERAFYRVGGMQPVKSNFRLVAATNRDLLNEVKKGCFREDLYYRLNVLSLCLPPLRDRGNDIILLAEHFLNNFSIHYGKHFRLTNKDKDKLYAYQWPGNIREIKNVIERAVILSSENNLVLDIPSRKESSKEHYYTDTYTDTDADTNLVTLDEVQRRYIKRILEKTGGRISGQDGAAALLGMKRSSLYTRMYKLKLK